MEGFLFFLVVVLLLNAIFWVVQFMDLMTMPDDDFPGRFDKVLWVVVFVALFLIVAPFAFGLWKEKNRRRLRERDRWTGERRASQPGPPAGGTGVSLPRETT
jgi:hypothetical protein